MEKQLHINLKYDSFERLFLISYDPKKHTFKWLAKAVFQRYTIFIPDVDKPPPPHLKLHIGDSKEVSICSNTFSPPIEALICDYVDEKDVVVCQFTNYDFHSNCIRIKFFLKYTGPSCERSYVDITAQQQEVSVIYSCTYDFPSTKIYLHRNYSWNSRKSDFIIFKAKIRKSY